MTTIPTHIETFLSLRGWFPWYHPNYWVHPETVTDATRFDYTSFGLSPERAYAWEQAGRPRTMFGTPNTQKTLDVSCPL